MNDLQVRWCEIEKVIPYTRNSRKIPERAIDKVAASIQEFGPPQAIVVKYDGVERCGHSRLFVREEAGLPIFTAARSQSPTRRRPAF